MSIIFDGKAYAHTKEEQLADKVRSLMSHGKILHVRTFVFREDKGSILYTNLKKAAALRLGIMYEPVEHSITDDLSVLIKEIVKAGKNASITGIMIQKPAKNVFSDYLPASNFESWWQTLTAAIAPQKDVDCLTKVNLEKLETGEGKLLPATVQAIISILEEAKKELKLSDEIWQRKSVAIIGRSDIVGKPLSWVLKRQQRKVDLFGKSDMPSDLKAFDIVICAVGKEGLITGDMIKDGAVVIDVGAPKGDIEFESVAKKAAFITPVPGGVGPITVVSLMENVVEEYKHI